MSNALDSPDWWIKERTHNAPKGRCFDCYYCRPWEGRPMCRRQQSFDFHQKWPTEDDVCDNLGEHKFKPKEKNV